MSQNSFNSTASAACHGETKFRKSIVRFENVRKTYQMGPVTVEALRGVSLDIKQGEYISIMGPSGCGKSTMLNLLGCLDRPTSGRYLLGEEDVSQMADDDLSTVRGGEARIYISII